MKTTSCQEIIHHPLCLLIPNINNPRIHNKKQIQQIANSISQFGFLFPVLINVKKEIICGHGRVLAAQLLGLTEVPTICAEHLSSVQVKALMIADNKLTENSTWNDELLAVHLKELSEMNLDFRLDVTGFSLDEIDLRIDGISPGPDPADQIPETDERPIVSRPNDLWFLGHHRLFCGDATKSESFKYLMNGTAAVMCFIDPPYNVNYANNAKDKLRGAHRPILNDNLGGEFRAFLLSVCSNVLSVTNGAIYICMSSSQLHILQDAFVRAGGHWSTFLIWVKQTFTLGRSDYQRQYEPILYGWREGANRYWCGARDQGDVWFFDKPARNDLHPTQKPVELVMRAIRNSSERDQIILDCFMGSGTTLIATERTGRICYGMELDPRYCDTIIRRWQQYTSETAIHAGTGKSFNELSALMEVQHAG